MHEQAKSIGNFLLDILQTIVLALAIFMIAYLFLFQPHLVKGQSMVPNFEDGEYLLTDKVTYRFGEPKRGDVIVFAAPPNKRDDYIKRIIGLPGEMIAIKNGDVYINDKILQEDYLPQSFATQPGAFLTEGTNYKLNPEEYIVIGDNRNHSSDSRTWGPIRKKDIVGRAWVVYWPPQKVRTVPRAN